MKYYFVESNHTNPYINLGYEEWIFDQLNPDESLFYLWQNQHTVVIGRNQNAYKECRVKQLIKSNGKLARRSSGGGAVYHDLGNLNYTFILPNEIYNVHRQLEVIIDALQKFDIKAEFVGRNNIEVDGAKVSGNAFAKKTTHHLHHGTLLYDANLSDLSKYLNVSTIKMESKGVESNRKRVANLVDFNPTLTLNDLKQQLKKSFEKIYQTKLIPIDMSLKYCQIMIEKHQSEEWQRNAIFEFDAQLHHRFSWGEVQVFFKVILGTVKKTKIFSDSLNPDFIKILENTLQNIDYDGESFVAAVEGFSDDYKKISMELINYLFGDY
jgi:lipoate---protein ligase